MKLILMRIIGRYLIAILCLTGFSFVSYAQQEDQLEEVIITGEKVARSLQKTVSSVGVLTETQIEEAAIYDLQDVYTRLANVNEAFSEEGIAIRGINHSSVGLGGNGGLVSVHFDGAFLSQQAIEVGQAELWDVRQVEVFRGPQSTNQGRNSLGGAVVIRSNDPTYDWQGKYRALVGQDGTQALSAAISGPILDDQIAFRLAVDDQHTDGSFRNETLNDDEFGSNSNTTVRGKLLFEPKAVDALSILLTASFSENESGDPFTSLIDENANPIDLFERRNFANVPGFENTDQTIFSLETSYKLSEQWNFKSTTSWNRSEHERENDSDRQATGDESRQDRIEDADTFSHEVSLNFAGDRLEGGIGLFYFTQDSEEGINDLTLLDLTDQIVTGINAAADRLEAFDPTVPLDPTDPLAALIPLLPIPPADFADLLRFSAPQIATLYPNPLGTQRDGLEMVEIENFAVYGNLSYELTDFITLFGGFRFDNEDQDRVFEETRTLTTPLPDPTAGLALPPPMNAAAPVAIPLVNATIAQGLIVTPLDAENDFSVFLPAAGITLNWTDDFNTSLRVQRAYRAGGAGTSTSGNFEFDPEFTTNYEFALRSQWLDGRLTANFNLFYIDWTDQQVQLIDPISPVEFVTVNASESSLFGFELEFSGRVNSNFSWYANAGSVDTEFDQFNSDAFDLDQDFTGNEFLFAADFSAAAGIRYSPTGALDIQADINYLSDSFTDLDDRLTPVDDSIENDARTVLNGKITYSFNDSIEVALVGRNLLDEDYITRVFPPFGFANIGQPRTISLQIQGSF